MITFPMVCRLASAFFGTFLDHGLSITQHVNNVKLLFGALYLFETGSVPFLFGSKASLVHGILMPQLQHHVSRHSQLAVAKPTDKLSVGFGLDQRHMLHVCRSMRSLCCRSCQALEHNSCEAKKSTMKALAWMSWRRAVRRTRQVYAAKRHNGAKCTPNHPTDASTTLFMAFFSRYIESLGPLS